MRNTRINMFEVDQSLDVLNDTLAKMDISVDDVVAIHEQAAGAMRIDSANQAKYRVFYRC